MTKTAFAIRNTWKKYDFSVTLQSRQADRPTCASLSRAKNRIKINPKPSKNSTRSQAGGRGSPKSLKSDNRGPMTASRRRKISSNRRPAEDSYAGEYLGAKRRTCPFKWRPSHFNGTAVEGWCRMTEPRLPCKGTRNDTILRRRTTTVSFGGPFAFSWADFSQELRAGAKPLHSP